MNLCTAVTLLPASAARDWKSGASNLMDVNSRPLNEVVVNLLPTPKASDGTHGGPNQRDSSGRYYLPGQAVRVGEGWLGSNGKDYGPAVRRWEEITGHPAPCPTEPGAKGNRRLSPAFSEWMMGLEPGWVTDIVTARNDALHVIGNGVVPRQAEAAFRFLMDDENWTEDMDDIEAVELNGPTKDQDRKPDKPRGKCTGCAFEYQLGTARTGEHKGELVIRKHNSRTGPGLCTGSQQPPEPTYEELEDAVRATAVARLSRDVVGVAPGGTPIVADPFMMPVPYAVPHDRTNAGDGGDQGVQPPQVHPGNGVSGVDGGAGPGRLRADQRERQVGDGAPADVSAMGGGDSREAVDRSPVQEHDLRGPGSPGSGDAVGEQPTGYGSGGIPQREEDALSAGAPVRRSEHAVRESGVRTDVSNLPRGSQSAVPAPQEDPFVSPGAASDIPESTVTVSGQPEPDRDSYGRYRIHGVSHTRATTFAKLGANTKAIEAWNERNVVRGLTLRPDLLMLANGLEVKKDRQSLNSIAAQAKDAAGSKVAANIGTAYHAFSERLDAGLLALGDIPPQYKPRVLQYLETITCAGLTTRPEWIERTTAVRADQVGAPLPVAGTLDRIFQLPDGSLVIGDLKTGSDLSYGEMEIEVQLALYAHGVNTHGLFDWNTKTWEDAGTWSANGVRTDIAIVVHLPADGDGCTLYVADIERGWRDAQRLGPLQASLKEKKRFRTLTAADLAPRPTVPAPVGRDEVSRVMALMNPVIEPPDSHWEHAKGLFSSAPDQAAIAQLYQLALDSGRFHTDQLAVLVGLGKDRLNELAKQR